MVLPVSRLLSVLPAREEVIEREVLIGRDAVTLPFALAAKPLPPAFARVELKKRCELDGAWRYEAGSAARLVAL
jgi:hypothetical protein